MPPPKNYTRCDGIYLPPSAANKLINKSLKWEQRKPIGLRFNPSDGALARIFADKLFDCADNIVLSLLTYNDNVYGDAPWNLSNDDPEFGEGKLYFFTRIRKKYGHGKNIERTVPGGFWQKTGSDSSIEVDELSIKKTSLAFYKIDEKSGEKEKTSWLMKEFKRDENFVGSNKQEVLVLCVVYKSGTRSEPFGEGSEQSSIPNPFCAKITASSSFLPQIQTQTNLNPSCLQNPSMRLCHFSFPTSTCHEIFGTSSNNQPYPNSKSGMIALKQRHPIFLNSEPNVVTRPQTVTFRPSFHEPVSETCFAQPIQDLGQSLDSLLDNLPYQRPDLMDYQLQPDTCENFLCSPSNAINSNLWDPNEEVNPYIDPIMDLNGPLWSPYFYTEYLVDSSWLQPENEYVSNQQEQPYFMDDPLQPAARENPISIVRFPSNTINNNNLLDPNGNLNYCIDPIMDPIGPLSFSDLNNSFCIDQLVDYSRPQPVNEHGSNQQWQPNSHSSSGQIIQQQPRDAAMTWNPSQQNPPRITPTSLQPSIAIRSFDELRFNGN